MIETKGRKTVLLDKVEFAKLLQLDVTRIPADKLLGRIHMRVAGIDLGDVCGRCGGTGNYSYNQMDGTRCYGCGGNKTLLPKLSEAFYEKVKAAVAEGKLAVYLEKLTQRQKAENAPKALQAIISASNIAKDYSAEYNRERDEEGAERRRADALAGGRAMGAEFSKHYNKANIKPMDETVKEYRFAQSAIHDEYGKLEYKLRKEKMYGMKVAYINRPLPTPEVIAECEALLLAKFEDIKARLEAQEAEYMQWKEGQV